ncbi:MAG: hypothetical protein QOE60_2936 [Thermoleophilaceae bacterium]|nr:hypothetical protein [Thermoleophilaceae bacterium]
MAIGGVAVGDGSDGARPSTALVIDAAAGRAGRELIDERLRRADAELRLPRTPTEAATDLRYLAAQGYRVVVAGPLATEAAQATGVSAVGAADVSSAVAALR